MSDALENFTFRVQHVGMDAGFYHPEGRDLPLSREVVEAFERDRENAEIFIQSSTDTAFSCAEMLKWFLLQSRTTIVDHLPRKAPAPGKILLTVPIRFSRGTFYMRTQAGDTDICALKLMLTITAASTTGA